MPTITPILSETARLQLTPRDITIRSKSTSTTQSTLRPFRAVTPSAGRYYE